MPWKKRVMGLLFVAMTFSANHISAKVQPTQGSMINATRTLFAVDSVKEAVSYMFKVAVIHTLDDKLFEREVKIRAMSSRANVIIQLPILGQEYSWSVDYYNAKGENIGASSLYHFKTTRENIDTLLRTRIRVLTNKYTDTSLLFFLDRSNCLYDLKGNIIWELPGNTRRGEKSVIKLTNFNTVTFLSSGRAHEVDYNGKLLWSTPIAEYSGIPASTYSFHHEFARTSKGTYMVLASQNLNRRVPPQYLDSVTMESTRNIDLGRIIEFDTDNNKLWEWKSSDYFSDEDIFSNGALHGYLDPSVHLNSFFFDEQQQVIYVGFRNRSKILKIKYPESIVLAEYNGLGNGVKSAFLKQHNVNVNKEGQIYFFNNNNGAPGEMIVTEKRKWDDIEDTVATLVILKQSGPGTYEKIWEFACNIDTETSAATLSGGSMMELADGSFLVCTGASSRIFIVNRNKKVLYNAIAEEWDNNSRKWIPQRQYRATPISYKQLDTMILTTLKANNG